MNRNKLMKWLIETICSLTNNASDKELSTKSNIYLELGIDSIDCFNLTLAIEDRFDIYISDSEVQMLYHNKKTIEQIAEFILLKIDKRNKTENSAEDLNY